MKGEPIVNIIKALEDSMASLADPSDPENWDSDFDNDLESIPQEEILRRQIELQKFWAGRCLEQENQDYAKVCDARALQSMEFLMLQFNKEKQVLTARLARQTNQILETPNAREVVNQLINERMEMLPKRIVKPKEKASPVATPPTPSSDSAFESKSEEEKPSTFYPDKVPYPTKSTGTRHKTQFVAPRLQFGNVQVCVDAKGRRKTTLNNSNTKTTLYSTQLASKKHMNAQWQLDPPTLVKPSSGPHKLLTNHLDLNQNSPTTREGGKPQNTFGHQIFVYREFMRKDTAVMVSLIRDMGPAVMDMLTYVIFTHPHADNDVPGKAHMCDDTCLKPRVLRFRTPYDTLALDKLIISFQRSPIHLGIWKMSKTVHFARLHAGRFIFHLYLPKIPKPKICVKKSFGSITDEINERNY